MQRAALLQTPGSRSVDSGSSGLVAQRMDFARRGSQNLLASVLASMDLPRPGSTKRFYPLEVARIDAADRRVVMLHNHRRFLADVTALALAGFGVGGDDVAFALARILALAIVRCSLACALPFARIRTQTLDLCRLRRRARRVSGTDCASGECQCYRRREHCSCYLRSLHRIVLLSSLPGISTGRPRPIRRH